MTKNTLHINESLKRYNDSENKLVSTNSCYELILQNDGNLVLYETKTRKPIFATNSDNSDSVLVKLQDDGNFVLYNEGYKNAKWASNTQNMGIVKLKLEDSGAITLYINHNKIILVLNTKRWMSVLDDSLTLKDICIPGSHDAGMYETSQKYAPGLGLTHSMNFKQQLEFGIRYFDLRPQFWSTNTGDDRYYAYHGLATGPKIKNILNDIESFFDSQDGKSESVIIGISSYKDFNETVKREFLELIVKYLGSYIFKLPTNRNISSLKLSEVRGKIIILQDLGSTEYKTLTTNNNLGNYFSESTFNANVFDKYAGTKYYDTMLDNQVNHFKDFNEDKLFLLNWTLTPDDGAWGSFKTITQSYTSIATYAQEINPHLLGWGHARDRLFKPNQHRKIVNIINGDYWEKSGYDVIRACFEVINNR